MNNLEKPFEAAAQQPSQSLPTGTRAEIAAALIPRCQERDVRLEREAINAARDDDDDGVWIAMAARAENRRLMEKIISESSPPPAGEL